MEPLRHTYSEIAAVLRQGAPSLLEEFEARVSAESPVEVFTWLDELSGEGRLPAGLDRLLTDFFYTFH
ncbi:MAG: hypothetical protein NTU41_13600 [Chloroflexi bacterium]|nr:hypothetical protein [Chloroflexota bacterium]